MFGKLKDKLKGALNLFSKETEESAEEKDIEIETISEPSRDSEESPEDIEVEEKVEVKKEIPKKEKKPAEKKEKVKKEKVVEEKKEEPKEEVVEEVKEEEITEQEEQSSSVQKGKPSLLESKDSESSDKPAEPKKSFFKRIFQSKEEKLEEEIDKAEEIKEEKKVIEEAKEKKLKKEKKKKEKEEEVIEEGPKEEEEKVEEVIEAPEEKEEVPAPEEKVSEPEEETVIEKEEAPEEPKTEESPVEEGPEAEEKTSFFTKIKKSFTTKTISAEKFDDLFWNLEIVLLENNVSVEVIEKIKEDLKEELVDKPLPRDVPKKIEDTLRNTMKEILSCEKIDFLKTVQKKKPFVIAFFGINGTGKTTSIAKLTNYLQENKLSVVLAACDTFRAAAIDQLEEHANKLGVKMIKHNYGSDAAAVAYDAIKFAEKNGDDVVMIDTAGRLHSNTNLMAELEKIIRVANPDLKIFVGESITGNDCIEQAKKFNELVEMDCAILTKADVDEKGGAPLSISYTIKKPIIFLGVGQEYKDLEEFDPDVILERLGF